MNQITLYRKDGRKEWVFEWDAESKSFIHKINNKVFYMLRLLISASDMPLNWRISRYETDGYLLWTDYQCKIKKSYADHFTLGNVTITF